MCGEEGGILERHFFGNERGGFGHDLHVSPFPKGWLAHSVSSKIGGPVSYPSYPKKINESNIYFFSKVALL